jgi:tRNA A-37 threonylcarbamoyl transferase component Bud32
VRYVGDYELLEEIGRGGMGLVFKARQVSLNRIVAVKMLLDGSFATEEGVHRFYAEAEAAAGLQHPNIVSIHEVGTHEGHHYFSMDYVEGRNLAEVAEGKPLPLDHAGACIRTVADAIHYAHQRGIIHRDLKPSNILLDSEGRPHVTDFGLSKRLDSASELTLSGQVLGAPSYMSPEQAAGKGKEAGVATDVYAVGAILYYLITGQPPFQGASLAETLAHVQNDEPEAPHQLNREMPLDLEAICLKCLRKNPRERYNSAADLAADLGRWLAGEPVAARSSGPIDRTWRRCRRHPARAALLVALCLSGIAAVVFWPRPPPLVIPGGVSELMVLSDNTESPGMICFTDPQGSFWHRLPVHGHSADVSPDGRLLCFVHQDGPTNSSIWVSRLDGSGTKRLVQGAACPLWLDERTIYFQTQDLLAVRAVDVQTLQTRDVFRWDAITARGCAGSMELSTDRKRLLVNPQNKVFKPSTGEFVFYAPTMDLYTCDPNGKNARVVWEDAGDFENPEVATTDCHQVWLGTDRIVWCRHARPKNRVQDMAIVVSRIGETNFQALTPWRGYTYPLAASPDGQRILFVTEDAPGGGNLELWTMKVDGSDRRKVLKRKFGCDLNLTGRWIPRPY